MIYLGIDPGKSGGIASIGSDGTVFATPMPKTERDIWDIIRLYQGERFALIEHVHSFPKQGVASSFKFGRSYGGLRMALIASGTPFERVSPGVWQKAMAIPPKGKKSQTEHKNILKAKAQELFPPSRLGEIKITHALADALLIAEYNRRRNGAELRQTAQAAEGRLFA